jgi:hypothetical protein
VLIVSLDDLSFSGLARTYKLLPPKHTRLKKNLHQPVTNLTQYQNGVLCKGTKMYNSLPTYIKEASTNTKKFAKVLKMFLYEKAFYTLDEFYTCHCD